MGQKTERKAWVEWSLLILLNQLALPDDARILDVKLDLSRSSLCLLIAHSGLPEVNELEVPMKVRAQYHTHISNSFDKWDY